MILSTVPPLLAQARPWDGHMMWGSGWMWIVAPLSLLLLAALIAGLVWVIARSGQSSHGGSTSHAREILDERYARGDITTDEYRERLDALR